MKRRDDIPLYANRSVLRCVEAAFDFIRANRVVWAKMALVLFMPVCVVLSLLTIPTREDQVRMFNDPFWVTLLDSSPRLEVFFLILILVGVWLSFVHVYSLLLADLQRDEGVGGIRMEDMRPYVLQSAKRSWWLGLMPLLIAFLVMLGGFFLFLLLLIAMVPLSLLPSVCILEDEDMATAVVKSFRLGFSSWFYLAFNILLTMAVASCMVWAFQIPGVVMGWLVDGLSAGIDMTAGHLPYTLVWVILAILSFFGMYVILSMVVMGCAFQYGSVSERVDDTSIVNEIEDFENL